jgi:hypothetical protein
VAPGVVKLCVGKVLGTSGCTLEMLHKGLWWAVQEEKANVVSMSLGYDLAGTRNDRLAQESGMAGIDAGVQDGDSHALSGKRRGMCANSLEAIWHSKSAHKAQRRGIAGRR